MFGRWLKALTGSEDLSAGGALRASIERELPGADPETISVVTSIAGLLGTVAYADRDYSAAEEARVRAELLRVQGMTESGVDAICKTLRTHIVEISAVETPRFTRALLELADEDLRREVLGAMVELAAADESITLAETNVLRQLTTSLGLSQQDYLELQQRHREHLNILKS
ncbi:MAG TPA: TerB family tellurite resistance protein [Polyangiaceae bacterium]|nr:TerB family tellurite resistance protein [Polyangiaceae bacterium]